MINNVEIKAKNREYIQLALMAKFMPRGRKIAPIEAKTTTIDVHIDAKETYFLSFNIRKKETSPIKVTNQEVNKHIPPKVETALPPLNP